jgi:HTH-type transcriptional regulator/antitoxin HigA
MRDTTIRESVQAAFPDSNLTEYYRFGSVKLQERAYRAYHHMQTKPSRSTTSSTTKNTSGGGGKKIVTAERRFNRRRYSALLAEAAPRVITSGKELERATKVAEPLLKKGERRTLEENALCQLVLKLIDDYQQSHTLIRDLAPHELLQALLEESGQRQAQLVPIFGSRSRVSDAVNGKRTISKEQAKRLGEYFHVTPAAFI